MHLAPPLTEAGIGAEVAVAGGPRITKAGAVTKVGVGGLAGERLLLLPEEPGEGHR
jgi:hypothetical protein